MYSQEQFHAGGYLVIQSYNIYYILMGLRGKASHVHICKILVEQFPDDKT